MPFVLVPVIPAALFFVNKDCKIQCSLAEIIQQTKLILTFTNVLDQIGSEFQFRPINIKRGIVYMDMEKLGF